MGIPKVGATRSIHFRNGRVGVRRDIQADLHIHESMKATTRLPKRSLEAPRGRNFNPSHRSGDRAGYRHTAGWKRECLSVEAGRLLSSLPHLAAQLGDFCQDVFETVPFSDGPVSKDTEILFNRRIEDGHDWRGAQGSIRDGILNRFRGEVEIRPVDKYDQRTVFHCLDCRQTGGIGGASRGARFHQEKSDGLVRFGSFLFDPVEILEVFEEYDVIGNNQRFSGVERQRSK